MLFVIVSIALSFSSSSFFFFNDTATTEIYTLSLHDALPISLNSCRRKKSCAGKLVSRTSSVIRVRRWRSEEHTSELQSHSDLVCRLLLEKKKKTQSRRKLTRRTGTHINV